MGKSATPTQTDVNAIWSQEWKKPGYSAKVLLSQRIFIEGYPVLKKYIPNGVKAVLDVGAATGRYSVKIAQDFPNATIYATDIVTDSLKLINALVTETGVTNVVVQREDATHLSFEDNTFDIVYSGMLLQILPDVEGAIIELRRVLKPSGLLIMSTVNFWSFHTVFKKYLSVFNRPPEYYGTERAFSRRELSALFRSNGLQVVALDGFSPAYGIYRLKMYWKPAAIIGRICSRVFKAIDLVTGRFASRELGFEIFCVAKK